MVINWDGGIAPCCWVEDPRFDFGNIRDIPLKEIWNGKAYTTARRVLQNRGKHPEDPEIICSICRGRPSYLEI
jgi:radical SAM protein with 4Fe4S-binding SPASM domain